MASISIWHLIVLLVVLGVPAVIIGGAAKLSARGKAPTASPVPAHPDLAATEEANPAAH